MYNSLSLTDSLSLSLSLCPYPTAPAFQGRWKRSVGGTRRKGSSGEEEEEEEMETAVRGGAGRADVPLVRRGLVAARGPDPGAS